MRVARYAVGDDVSFGVIAGQPGDEAVAAIAGHPFAPWGFTGVRHPLEGVRLLAPVLPSKVVCVGRNYAEHAREMGGESPAAPVIFFKPSTAVIGQGDPIVHPAGSERVDHEGELAVVIGRLCRDVPPARVAEVVLGYTCANDVTARDWQQADGQWSRAKGQDTFCPLGPWIETDLDISNVTVRTTVDGEVRQDGRTSELLHDVPALISYLSQGMTLLPGDVVLTGTPAGVGPIQPGQTVRVEVGGVGVLRNPVVAQ